MRACVRVCVCARAHAQRHGAEGGPRHKDTPPPTHTHKTTYTPLYTLYSLCHHPIAHLHGLPRWRVGAPRQMQRHVPDAAPVVDVHTFVTACVCVRARVCVCVCVCARACVRSLSLSLSHTHTHTHFTSMGCCGWLASLTSGGTSVFECATRHRITSCMCAARGAQVHVCECAVRCCVRLNSRQSQMKQAGP